MRRVRSFIISKFTLSTYVRISGSNAARRGIYEVSEAMLGLASTFLLEKSLGGETCVISQARSA